jgi:hypothetical protein
MPRNDSGDSTGALARTSESTGLSESRRGVVGPAEQLKLVEAIRAWFDQGFQKTPAYPSSHSSHVKDNLQGGLP